MLALRRADLAVAGLHLVEFARLELAHGPRKRVGRRALEDGEVLGLLGDNRDQLHARRTGADDADPLTAEVDVVPRPAAGEQRGAREGVHTLDVGFERRGEDARRGDDERRGERLARFGFHRPRRVVLVERHRGDVGVEPDVAAQVQPIGDEVEVRLDLGLGGHRLRPHPLLLDLVGEAVGVLDALDVAARTGIPVEQPGAADLVGPLDDDGPQAELSQPVQCIETGEPGTDHDRVEATT